MTDPTLHASLQDQRRHPPKQLAELYRQRWEIEKGFRDIEHSLQDGEPMLRSKRSELVRQELWGVMIAYTLLRHRAHKFPTKKMPVS